MPLIDLRPAQFRRLLKRRRESGGDRYDEVWDGVYVMSPLADIDHQLIVGGLVSTISGFDVLPIGSLVFPGVNVSDRRDDWRRNFRCPDVAVFLPGNPARHRRSHWLGGPDFAVEIISNGDRSRKKFDFYAKVGVRELMILDRNPWKLDLYRRNDDAWILAGSSSPGTSQVVPSAVLPVSFRLLPDEPRPRIEIATADGARSRLI